MAYEVVIPRLGLTMEEGRVVEWYKQDGETIEAGEPLFGVETDKAIQDVEAPVSGVVYHVPDIPSEPLPVGTVIGYIAAPGEEVALPVVSAAAVPVEAPAGVVESTPDAAPIQAASAEGRKLSSPAARWRAKELGIDWRTIEHPEGKPILVAHVEEAAVARTIVEAPPEEMSIKASPVARRMAKEASIDLGELAARKPSGRIHREDVEAAIAAREALAAPSQPIPTEAKTVPVTQVRRVIAQRMTESAHTTAAVTLTTEADATELVALRERLQTALTPQGTTVPTYNDLFVKLTSVALQDHPMLNAYWKAADPTGGQDEIVVPSDVHIAVAIDTEAGLLAPIIRDVKTKSIQQIADEFRSLVKRAYDHQLGADDLQGGTFTITNLGMYGIDAFTPIINLPQCAILGIGRIVEKAAVWDGQVVACKRIALSLTFDHRVVDGGPAARFLDTIREYVEQPYLWLTQ